MRYATIVLSSAFLSVASQASAQMGDPREGLGAGWMNAKEAARNMVLVAHRDRPEGFFNAANPGDFGVINADMAFAGGTLYLGGFHGVQVWDISKPASPTLRTTLVCPGGQGDVSIYKNLLFMSVEETRSRVDCGTKDVTDSVSAERFRGVRIFDITNIDQPKQVASIQSCRGSHTHTLVTDPRDAANVYIYISGTSVVRSPTELAGCSGLPPDRDPNTSLFRIDIIQVPVARPHDARIVNSPRIFADSAGNIAGLWKGGAHGEGTQSTSNTNQCHDITAYTEMGVAAGACSGNGILLDISNPAAPKRITEVSDPNFAYWHSATFNNDASKVLFTDEWGGGTQPRCRVTDPPLWGGDAIFVRSDGNLRLAGYFKLPAKQTATENCVAHNGSLIPVPGRDIMAQAWYQGGVSVFDFTDPAHVREIAFFDRGPMDSTKLYLSGFWGTYWYNGYIYGSEIGRGLDVFELKPSQWLTQNELDAAKLVRVSVFNPQNQTKIVWPVAFVVARAYLDQLVRNEGLLRGWATPIRRDLDRAEKLKGSAQRNALTKLAAQLDADAKVAGDASRVRAVAGVVRELANKR